MAKCQSGNELHINDLVLVLLGGAFIKGRVQAIEEGGMLVATAMGQQPNGITPGKISVVCHINVEFDPRANVPSLLLLVDPEAKNTPQSAPAPAASEPDGNSGEKLGPKLVQ